MLNFARTYGALMYIEFCESNFLVHNKLTYLILPMNETNKTRTYPAVTSERKELFVQIFSGSYMNASYRKVRKCWLSCSPFFLTFLDYLLVQGQRLFESSSISDIEPCLQSAGISSSLPLCCPSISFSADL